MGQYPTQLVPNLLWATRGRCTALMIRLSSRRDCPWVCRHELGLVKEGSLCYEGWRAEPASATLACEPNDQARPQPDQASRTSVMYSAIRQHYYWYSSTTAVQPSARAVRKGEVHGQTREIDLASVHGLIKTAVAVLTWLLAYCLQSEVTRP